LFVDVIWGAETESGIVFCVTCFLLEIQLKIDSEFFLRQRYFSNFDGTLSWFLQNWKFIHM